jgi:predicted DCC family thiol-disulfide oxidoreductase YuxK
MAELELQSQPAPAAAAAAPAAAPGGRAPPALVFYDGLCGLCERTMRLAAPRARHGALRFVDSGSPEGRMLLSSRALAATAEETLVVFVGDRVHVRSGAVVQVLKRLRWPWRAQAALWLVPRPVRDWLYDQVARRRERSCPVHGPGA